jgi:hypothetical protein
MLNNKNRAHIFVYIYVVLIDRREKMRLWNEQGQFGPFVYAVRNERVKNIDRVLFSELIW